MVERLKVSLGNLINGADKGLKMKQRNGFVSNSSSSSFVIALDKDPTKMNVEELRKLLFGEQELFAKYDYAFTTQELAETVLKDIQYRHEKKEKTSEWSYNASSFKGKLSKEGLIATISSGHFDGCPDLYTNYYDSEDYKLEDEAKKQGIEKPYQDPKWGELIRKARDKRYAEEERLTNEAATELLANTGDLLSGFGIYASANKR